MLFHVFLVCVLPLFPLRGTYVGILGKVVSPYPSISFSHSKSSYAQADSTGFLHFSPEQGKSMAILHIGVVTSNLKYDHCSIETKHSQLPKNKCMAHKSRV